MKFNERTTAVPRRTRRVRVAMTPKVARATALALGQMARWGLLDRGWGFCLNARKRGMGLCVYPQDGPDRVMRTPGRIELSKHLVERNEEAEVLDTILHEIAHALVGPGHGHDAVWRAMCLKVGAKPNRCGDADMPAGKWQAVCPGCGKVYHRHRRPKYVAGYYCPRCGKDHGCLSFRQA